MYSKGSLATGLDAGEAFLNKGRAQWGRKTRVYCTLTRMADSFQNHRLEGAYDGDYTTCTCGSTHTHGEKT